MSASAFYGYHLERTNLGFARVERNTFELRGASGNYYKYKKDAQKAAIKHNKLMRRVMAGNRIRVDYKRKIGS